MKTTLPILALCLLACSLFAPMHQQQPAFGPPPLPPLAPPRNVHRARTIMHFARTAAWPAKTNFLTLTNLTYIRIENQVLINLPPEAFRRLTQAYADDVVVQQTIHFWE